ncbi:DMT family transporter [Luteolibacter sp. LG18]|uniref:DMT family transporter n=1 Tax=Luteolibacter sp. LG18 TaxID=2819286 RepID=UPI0030C6845D
MPVLFLIVACALWGLSFPVVKALHYEQTLRIPEASSAFLAAWMQVGRFGLGALILLPLLHRVRPTRRELRQGLLLALWGGFGMAVQADGLAYTAASTSAFLTQAYCVILPLWACLRLRQWPTLRVVGATVLVMIGGAILAGLKPGDLRLGRGEIETLVGACIFTFQILTLENPRYDGNRGLPVTFVMCTAIALLFIPIAWLLAPTSGAMIAAGASWPAFALVAVLALFCSVGAYLLMNIWQPRVSATEAGLIYTIEPVFTAGYALALPAWLGGFVGASYPNETLTFSLVAGGSLILAANVLMQWRRPPHDPSIAPAP